MRFGFSEASFRHDTGPRHPESADRLHAVRSALESSHVARFESPPPTDRQALSRVHTSAHIDDIQGICRDGGGAIDSDTVVSEGTWAASLASAGLAVWTAETAVSMPTPGDLPFALCRPPGHHAVADTAMGFCIFNNVAVAAESVIASDLASSVAILDWDVHHGNGTQSIFVDRGDVPFVSIHEDGLYPGTGGIDEIGTGEGQGATLNVPLDPGANTASYLAVMDDVVRPWLRGHEPDLLLVSAGFDAHRHDPISRMAVSTEGYGELAHRVLSLSATLDVGLGFVLEGGYGLDTLSDSVTMVSEVCHGYEPEVAPADVRAADRSRIDAARDIHGLGS